MHGQSRESRIKYFPVSFFAMVMGLAGLSIAWHRAEQVFSLQLAGELDALARLLYYAGLFLTLLLATQAPRFLRLKFYLSWWAYSFPLAAMATATLIMFQLTQLTAFAAIGWLLLSTVSLVVVYLLYRTARAVGGGHICIPAL